MYVGGCLWCVCVLCVCVCVCVCLRQWKIRFTYYPCLTIYSVVTKCHGAVLSTFGVERDISVVHKIVYSFADTDMSS